MSDKLLTIREAADILKVHWQTVRHYIGSGKINAAKVGRNIRIRESDLQSFIDNKAPVKQKKEIEIRFATKNRKRIEEKLLMLNAKIIYHGHIMDHWYAPNYIKNMRQKDKFYESGKGFGIRIREQDNGYTGKITTTLEVKKLAYPPSHEVCIEEEIEVESFEKTQNFLTLIEEKKKQKKVYFINICRNPHIFNLKAIKKAWQSCPSEVLT